MLAILEHMAALSDHTRCRLLLLLEARELTVSELCAVLQMPQSSVSRHLKTLADDRLVESRRDGTSRYYGMSTYLDEGAAELWPIIRAEVAAMPAARQDDRRLTRVLSRRRTKSQEFFASAAAEWDTLRAELFGEASSVWGLLGLIDSSLTVGDLGCGTGRLAELLAPLVARVIAVDSSPDMLAAARERLAPLANVEVRAGDVETLPLDDRTLGAAVLSLVLHHVPDPRLALMDVARVMKPGGQVVVVDMLPHDHIEYQRQMGHVWLGFSELQITRLMSAAGFEHVRVRGVPPDPDARGPALFAAAATRRRA